ncbi:unnamed protein product [Durusdinium trenchii]|uniref:Uncharacterized protein n=1 Tax=Durusdinium trenchii TaxID=1381693 RepID=A0ABP0LF58_9DINO
MAIKRTDIGVSMKDPCIELLDLITTAAAQASAEEVCRLPETLARVQQRTAELLAQAAANGELERVLGDIQKNEEAETRKRVAKTLVEAADSGLLSTILSEVKASSQDLTAIRMRVQEQLEKAAADGRLEKALRLEAPRWNLQPSVGTWLVPRTAEALPAPRAGN